ncbi:HAD family hydrolase [uncultured Jatrophihabitans sp.]|uniref:HAD family hydrolase n=1 Tax=uncultured Jatrophihabitans sp. TaxID=1610747 RepID=UPI0035CA318F
MSALVATDLDRTLIYSLSAAGHAPNLVPVERRRDADVSWMTARAAAVYARLTAAATVVPVTTRTPEQWQRITLPGRPPRHVIAANGGVLLVAGRRDAAWDATVAARLTEVAPLAAVRAHAERVCRADPGARLRDACEMFCYAVLDGGLPAEVLAEAAAAATAFGWQLSLQGRKLYWVPRTLTKSAAVTEVARRVGADRVLAAGDSLLDADLLEHADRGVVAQHGELVASGWRAPHVDVTTARWAAAGEEIVRWFAAELSAVTSSRG